MRAYNEINSVSITVPDLDNIEQIMLENSFTQEDRTWTKNMPKTETNTVHRDDLPIPPYRWKNRKIIAETPPETPHDGIIRMINGSLCIDVKTNPVWKSAFASGIHRIYLDISDKTTILKLMESYDVICTKEAEQAILPNPR